MKAIHHIFVFIASTFLAVLGRAQTFDYWLGSATTNAWSFASNWSMGVKPPTNGIAVFTNNSAYAYPPSFDNSDTFQALDVQGSASLLVSLANTPTSLLFSNCARFAMRLAHPCSCWPGWHLSPCCC